MTVQPFDDAEATHLLIGSIDTHIHTSPDVIPRKLDDLALAREAANVGMQGIVLKCHVAPTEGRAFLVQQVVPHTKVWGGIALNTNVGGLNPEAVRISVKMGAKIVWMPTVSAANHVNIARLSEHLRAMGGNMKEPGITIYQKSGKLKAETCEILAMIKAANIILATGHLSPGESLDLIDEAIRQGIKKILFTHPEGQSTHLPLDEQKRLASKGVFFERCWIQTTDTGGKNARIPPEQMAVNIRTVGPSSTVMATDHGQFFNPTPVEAMKDYISALLRSGFQPNEIELMNKSNPSQLLEH